MKELKSDGEDLLARRHKNGAAGDKRCQYRVGVVGFFLALQRGKGAFWQLKHDGDFCGDENVAARESVGSLGEDELVARENVGGCGEEV